MRSHSQVQTRSGHFFFVRIAMGLAAEIQPCQDNHLPPSTGFTEVMRTTLEGAGGRVFLGDLFG